MPFDPTQSYGLVDTTNPQIYVQAGVYYKSTDLSVVANPEVFSVTNSGVVKASAVPAGGVAGQYLAKSSSIDGDATWFGPPLTVVSGSGINIDTATTPGSAILNYTPDSSAWAARGSGTYVGQLKRITDIGPTGGTLFSWNGSVWYLVARAILAYDLSLHTAATLDTNENILASYTMPAGLLKAGRMLTFNLGFAKDGTTDNMTGRLRIGSLGTTADTAISSLSNGTMIASQRSGCIQTILDTATANTTLRHLGLLSFNSGFSAGASATVWPSDVTVADFTSNPLIASFSSTMGGATNHGQVAQIIVELWP